MAMDIYYRINYVVPIDWLEVLLNVQHEAPQAFIAGGCLRDFFNDKPINDIDIFVPSSREITGVKVTHPKLSKSIPEPYLTHDINVQYIRYYEDPTGKLPPVNLIGVTDYVCTPWDQLERFDFGICRVAFDGQRIWKDTGFDRDIVQKTFTLKEGQTGAQLNYSLGRFERISAKYPGFKLVKPSDKWSTF